MVSRKVAKKKQRRKAFLCGFASYAPLREKAKRVVGQATNNGWREKNKAIRLAQAKKTIEELEEPTN